MPTRPERSEAPSPGRVVPTLLPLGVWGQTYLKFLNSFILSLLFLSFFLIFVLFFKNTNFKLIIIRDNENKALEN